MGLKEVEEKVVRERLRTSPKGLKSHSAVFRTDSDPYGSKGGPCGLFIEPVWWMEAIRSTKNCFRHGEPDLTMHKEGTP